MSETNKKEAGVQEETEKDLPETEPVTEPVEESPEATAGTETTEETESAAEDDKESDGWPPCTPAVFTRKSGCFNYGGFFSLS